MEKGDSKPEIEAPENPCPRAFAGQLLERIDAYRGNREPHDDLTAVVIRHSAEEALPLTVGRLVRVLPRMLGPKSV